MFSSARVLSLLAISAAPILPGPLPNPGIPRETPIRPGPPAGIDHTASCDITRTVSIPSMHPGMFIHARGDTELGGGAGLTLEAKLRHTDGRVWVDLKGEIGQESGRPTVFTRHLSSSVAVSVPVGCRIKSVSPPVGRINEQRHHDTSTTTIYGSTLIDEATCTTDTSGTDDGEVGCSEVKFRDITVQLERNNPKCRDVVLKLGTTDLYGLTEHTGNVDLGKGRTRVELDTMAKVQGTAVNFTTRLRVEEQGGDKTVYDQTVSRQIFSIARDAPGCEITSIVNPSGRIRGQHRRSGDTRPRRFGHQNRWVNGPPAEGNLVSANCRTNVRGSDRGKIGCTRIRFKPLTIKLRPKS